MGRITDKYHQIILTDTKHLNPLFDIKEVPKRTYQLGIAILVMGIFLSLYDSSIGMYVSSFLVACFCFSILMFMLLKYQDAIKDLTISIISMACGWLIFSACLEGLQSEQYLYFFPLLISVPLLVDLKQTRYRKSFSFICIILFSFFICIAIGNFAHPLEDFTTKQIVRLALVNRITALFTTIVFAALYTFFEKKYIDELVEQSNKVINTKTQFLATMGHELRTPLNGIIGIVTLLKNEPDAVKQGEYINILEYCSNHMLQQVNDILDFNKIEAGKLTLHTSEVNLSTLLLNVIKPFTIQAIEKRIEITVYFDPAINDFVFVDEVRLIQVFNNLLANALKFTNKGSIKLKAFCKNSTDNDISVIFSVEDTGIGVDIADQEKIFESFWQVYDESTRELTGTGLGLNICNRLLRLMGGSLRLESEKGKGSTFIFELTLKRVRKQQLADVAETIEEKPLSGVNVLLVEDNKINMMVANKVLTNLKAVVTPAFNGKQALEVLNNNAAFQLILMDLEMPVMNGYTAIYEMKKLYPHIPVIALTASLVDERMLADLLASGFDDCLLKPFKPDELAARIKKFV